MFFQTDNDIFPCGVYIPSKNTTQNILSKTDYLADYEKVILKYQEKGNILNLGIKMSELSSRENHRVVFIFTYNIFYLKLKHHIYRTK